MDEKVPKILMIVEGAKTDVKLMTHLLNVYGISQNHEIVSYNTNIYTLYREMFADGDPGSMDILQILKARENDPNKKKIFDEIYSDILLIFDLDPQDPDYSATKILEMQEYFTESSDMGKMYLNYPMVEAFYHMESIPDDNYPRRFATLEELKEGKYKSRVNKENRNHDYNKFAVNREECNIVIKQNIEKGFLLIDDIKESMLPDLHKILVKQIDSMETLKKVFVLCSCVYYIVEYNYKLIE
ncbi:hypothetical protein [Ruminococcus sp.]|uniref:hypothetical protein n=1 Tax=Ruminococcus sp. TaxID=41978 RepID=UPI0025E74C4B|nr:hypothetical protein [Ruminococcus sp.]